MPSSGTEREGDARYGAAFHSVYARMFLGFCGLIAFVTGVVIALAPSLHSGGLVVVAIGAPVLGAAVLVRCLRVRLVIARDELVIHNVFSTRRLRASDIREIGWKSFWMMGGYTATPIPTLGIRRGDGKTVISTAVLGCGAANVDDLLTAVGSFAIRHGLSVSVKRSDIYLWTWSRRKVPKSPELR